jgi:hypothetical protein
MLAPGMTIDASNRVQVDQSAGNSSNFIHGGFGFKTSGDLCLDSAAVTGTTYNGGWRVNSTGCIFSTTSTNASDVWSSGLRRSASGQIVIEAAAGTSFVNGNPLTSNGVLAVVL